MVVETHVSTLFFVDDHVFKRKRPIKTGFLDFTSLDARRRACESEVEVNKRFAPDVYLGVFTLTDAEGSPCEYLVGMRRMPADRCLAQLVSAGADVEDDLRRVAHEIAAAHGRCATSADIAAAATPEALLGAWRTNITEIRGLPAGADLGELDRIDALAERFIEGRRPLLDRRIADGRVIEGHGDLQAADIFVLDDGPRILDAIEFDPSLRHVDVLSDVSFLAMDLERLGRVDLGQRFVSRYRDLTGDNWPRTLEHHYIAHRALVRAKVARIRRQQTGAASDAEEARLLSMCLGHLERARVKLIVVGGLPGTGKSTIAELLSKLTGAVVLRSDEVRKRLAGLAAADHSGRDRFDEGLYDRSHTEATYTELLREAERLLSSGETVILDATWSHAPHRDRAAAIATATRSELHELQCVASRDVAASRIGARLTRGGDASDADADVARRLAETADPWPTATVIRTDSRPDAALSQATAAVA